MSFGFMAMSLGFTMLIGGLIAALSRGITQLLAGLIVVSFAASGFMWLAGVPLAFVLVIGSLFLVTDLAFFLFHRRKELAAHGPPRRPRLQGFFRFCILAAAFTILGLSGRGLWSAAFSWISNRSSDLGLAIWGQYSFFPLLAMTFIPLLFIGGFLLVRRGGVR